MVVVAVSYTMQSLSQDMLVANIRMQQGKYQMRGKRRGDTISEF